MHANLARRFALIGRLAGFPPFRTRVFSHSLSSMFTVTWHFLPAPGREKEFLHAYGPDGPWVALFRRARGYLGTDLAPLPGNPGWYRTIDRWISEEDYRAFRAAFGVEYGVIDKACEQLTREERPVP